MAEHTGIERIAAERKRQIEAEGYTPEHDASHDDNSLAFAASCYAAPGVIHVVNMTSSGVSWHEPWPQGWRRRSSPHSNTTDTRLRDLEKAGALIAAEIDRIVARGSWIPQRTTPTTPPQAVSEVHFPEPCAVGGHGPIWCAVCTAQQPPEDEAEGGGVDEHGADWTDSLPGEPPSCRCGYNGTPEECAASRTDRAAVEG